MSKLNMVRQIGSLAGHVLAEKVRPHRPTDLSQVPASPDHLTTEYLTAALCARVPGAQVTGFTIGGGSDGSTSRAALTVTYNDAGTAAGLPAEVFTKATPKLTSRLITVPSGALFTEERFYNSIQPELGDLETPTGYHAAVDLASGRSMFLLENIAVTRGATFGDTRELYVDRAKAEDQMRLLATLHGRFWDSPRLTGDLGWMKTSLQFQIDCNEAISFEGRSLVGLQRAADVVPAQLHDRGPDIWAAAMRSLESNVSLPMTVLHSDVHLNNWYVTGEGRMGLCDWQLMTRGNWALDVAYALTSALTVEDRRAWERELIGIYLDALGSAGGIAPAFDEAWLRYRQQVFHGLIFWLYTIGHGRLQPAMQPDDVSRINLERMTNALVDLDSLESI
ncbi:MAG TPA: aminoglycoside phosphotransferase family protein [Pseudonocardia sp.]|nr:aminoglycoside phosphotransferase family protein [Pseudonocardia sp.]